MVYGIARGLSQAALGRAPALCPALLPGGSGQVADLLGCKAATQPRPRGSRPSRRPRPRFEPRPAAAIAAVLSKASAAKSAQRRAKSIAPPSPAPLDRDRHFSSRALQVGCLRKVFPGQSQRPIGSRRRALACISGKASSASGQPGAARSTARRICGTCIGPWPRSRARSNSCTGGLSRNFPRACRRPAERTPRKFDKRTSRRGPTWASSLRFSRRRRKRPPKAWSPSRC